MDILEELKKTRLMVLARGVPKDVLLKAVAAIEEAGVTVFESTFDHRARIVLTDEEVEKCRSRWPVGQESTPGT